MKKSKNHLVYLRKNLFETTEEVRKRIGLSRSGFYRYCIVRTLDSMNVLSPILKEAIVKEENRSGQNEPFGRLDR